MFSQITVIMNGKNSQGENTLKTMMRIYICPRVLKDWKEQGDKGQKRGKSEDRWESW